MQATLLSSKKNFYLQNRETQKHFWPSFQNYSTESLLQCILTK